MSPKNFQSFGRFIHISRKLHLLSFETSAVGGQSLQAFLKALDGMGKSAGKDAITIAARLAEALLAQEKMMKRANYSGKRLNAQREHKEKGIW